MLNQIETDWQLDTDWQTAWRRALYAPGGFYLRPEGPAGHFRTACHAAAPLVAQALTVLADRHGCDRVVDVGAGRGELLNAVRLSGLGVFGIDLVERPAGLAEGVGWSVGLAAAPDSAFRNALVVCWELLDTVPCSIAELDDDGAPRLVHVDQRTGVEELGGALVGADRAWLHRYWPFEGGEPGDRFEIGRTRDAFWQALVARVAGGGGGGLLLAVDYAHDAAQRPQRGSLAAFRRGRAVPPVPDGSCDLTAHVALDAVAAAGERAGAQGTRLINQREALRELGIDAVPLGDSALPAGLLDRLAVRSAVAELTDPGGLGGFSWLLQTVRPTATPSSVPDRR